MRFNTRNLDYKHLINSSHRKYKYNICLILVILNIYLMLFKSKSYNGRVQISRAVKRWKTILIRNCKNYPTAFRHLDFIWKQFLILFSWSRISPLSFLVAVVNHPHPHTHTSTTNNWCESHSRRYVAIKKKLSAHHSCIIRLFVCDILSTKFNII